MSESAKQQEIVPLTPEQIDELCRKGVEAVEKGYFHSAQIFLGQALEHRKSPELYSYLAFCMAQSQKRLHAAAKTCRESIRREPRNSLHYLMLGRILLMDGDKSKAIDAFREGLKASPNPLIIDELKKLGLRKQPPIKSLARNHTLNRFFGKITNFFGGH